MINGETPRTILDIVMTWFEEDYNPLIVYDAACKAMEVALNREPRRFGTIRLVSDPLHADNHTNCSKAFNSRLYSDLLSVNKVRFKTIKLLKYGI